MFLFRNSINPFQEPSRKWNPPPPYHTCSISGTVSQMKSASPLTRVLSQEQTRKWILLPLITRVPFQEQSRKMNPLLLQMNSSPPPNYACSISVTVSHMNPSPPRQSHVSRFRNSFGNKLLLDQITSFPFQEQSGKWILLPLIKRIPFQEQSHKWILLPLIKCMPLKEQSRKWNPPLPNFMCSMSGIVSQMKSASPAETFSILRTIANESSFP
jgi:hypothetical protein